MVEADFRLSARKGNSTLERKTKGHLRWRVRQLVQLLLPYLLIAISRPSAEGSRVKIKAPTGSLRTKSRTLK